ncbi:MAG: hypothetical protein HYT63_02565 [Candidatus Yanofskybacteria bacterium]|nr:hypothetical protein [Candidatus Yanofskybacteria bacterium]
MLTNATKKIKSIPSYLYRNYAAPRIYGIRDRRILLKNLELKNKYTGQRCFIIGAGPSIADTDLSKLNKECTFVVNEFEKNKQYGTLKPKFHVIVESNYFTEGRPEYWRERFKEKDRNIPVETTMIINLKAIPFINKHGLFKKHNIYYVGTQGIFSKNLPFNIKLDKYVPNPKNSVLMCLIAAAWMGFEEIYLLGCEHSFLAQPTGQNQSLGFSHGYSEENSKLSETKTEDLPKYITAKEMNLDYEANIAHVLQLFRSYRLFYAKVLKVNPNFKILNATPNSFLDIFPVVNFADIKLHENTRT